MSYGMVDGACAQAISNEAVETSSFYGRVKVHSIAQMVDVVCTDVAENTLPTPVLSNGIGLWVASLWSGEALLTG